MRCDYGFWETWPYYLVAVRWLWSSRCTNVLGKQVTYRVSRDIKFHDDVDKGCSEEEGYNSGFI